MSPTAYPLPTVVTSTPVIVFNVETIVKIAPAPFPDDVVAMSTNLPALIGSEPVVVEVSKEFGVVFNAVPVPFTNNKPFVVISLPTKSVLFIDISALKSTLLPPPLPLPSPWASISEVRPLIAVDGILLLG